MLPNEITQLEKAIVNSNLSGSARNVLKVIMRRSNNAGECEVSVGVLADHCGYCMRTINNRLNELIRKGWIIREEQFDMVDGRQLENLYIIQKPMQGQEQSLSPIDWKKAKEITQLEKAIVNSNLSGSARAVLRELMRRSNNEGECVASMGALANHCGYSLCTINTKMNELIRNGWVIYQEQFNGEDGRRLENLYIIQKPNQRQKQSLSIKMDCQMSKIEQLEEEINMDVLKETIKRAEYTKSAKKVLTVLASHMEKNEPYVTVATLVTECKYSGRIVRLRLKELGENGWIAKIEQRTSKSRVQLANLYRIKIPNK